MAEQNNRTDEFTPPKKNLTVEFWVGLFVLIGLVCFSYLAINIAGMKINNTGYYTIKAVFNSVSGLKVGSPVEIAGVKVGEVTDVHLDTTEAVVTMLIKDEVLLRSDDIAQIRTKGIIGDRYIKISPGGSDSNIQKGGSINDTESAVEFEEIIGKFIHSLDNKEK